MLTVEKTPWVWDSVRAAAAGSVTLMAEEGVYLLCELCVRATLSIISRNNFVDAHGERRNHFENSAEIKQMRLTGFLDYTNLRRLQRRAK